MNLLLPFSDLDVRGHAKRTAVSDEEAALGLMDDAKFDGVRLRTVTSCRERKQVRARVAFRPTSQSDSERHFAASASGRISSSERSFSQASMIAWFVIGWTFFVSWLGAVLDLPRWLIRLTPLGPLPRLPQEPMAWGPVLGVSALTLACLAAGLAGYRRRDLLTG